MSPSSDPQVVITAAAVLTPLGDEPAAVHQALCAGRTALAPLNGNYGGGLPPLTGAPFAEFDAGRYLPGGSLRPLDRVSRLAAATTGRALEAGGWTAEECRRRQLGLVLGTMFGGVGTIAAFDRRAMTAGPAYAKPMDFANSVINAAAGQTAIRHRLEGINATVSAGVPSGLQAIGYAADLIRMGQAEALVAGGVDELCFETLHAFAGAGRLCPAGDGAARPVPFEARRGGRALGEAAALLVLESADCAAGRGAPVLAVLRGQGTGFDPSRGGSPEGTAAAIARAVELALAEAGLAATDLDCLAAGASGCPAGDRAEALGVAGAVGESARRLPVTACKGALGETLGASGPLQTVLLLEAMAAGVLPGIAGLERPEEDLPLGGLSADARPLAARRGLVTSVGLDGKSCALVVERC